MSLKKSLQIIVLPFLLDNTLVVVLFKHEPIFQNRINLLEKKTNQASICLSGP